MRLAVDRAPPSRDIMQALPVIPTVVEESLTDGLNHGIYDG